MERHFLFLLAGTRRDGNSELLARRAAAGLPAHVRQTWLRLTELPLPPFYDLRHSGDGTYPAARGHSKTLLEATLTATDIVVVAPLYWYGLPASAKLYLDHWSGWLRIPKIKFKVRMKGKTLWAISSYSGDIAADAEPLFSTLRLTANYIGMRWGGSVLGSGNRPGDVLEDANAMARAEQMFQSQSAEAEARNSPDKKLLLGISGSLRSESMNRSALLAIEKLLPPEFRFQLYADLDRLPHFNPDLRDGREDSYVSALRSSILRAHAVVFSVPEYAHGVPGALKNALDWQVGTGELCGKPVLLVRTSPRAEHAQEALREILSTMGAEVLHDAEIRIDLIGARLSPDEIARDAELASAICKGIHVLRAHCGIEEAS